MIHYTKRNQISILVTLTFVMVTEGLVRSFTSFNLIIPCFTNDFVVNDNLCSFNTYVELVSKTNCDVLIHSSKSLFVKIFVV